MKLLLIILAMMSFTVKDKSSVTADGQWPYDMNATFVNSSSQGKGNVGKNDVATLRVTGLDGIIVEKVEVYVNSNKTSGAGTFEVKADVVTIGRKSGTFKDWTGNYDNASFHAVRLFSGAQTVADELLVTLSGTENTLHVEKYVIQYSMTQPQTVTLMRGERVYSQLTEEYNGAGVVLPGLPDTAEWRFAGWSETVFTETQTAPVMYAAYSTYYPDDDAQLWAVYRHDDTSEQVYATELESGEYLYVNRDLNIALTGEPKDGEMSALPVDMANGMQVYRIDFVGTDTAYIMNSATDVPIGYSGKEMAKNASPWLVYHDGEETIFYMIFQGKKHVLWLNIMDLHYHVYAGLFQVDNLSSPMALCYPDPAEKPVYTCYPESARGLETVTDGRQKGEWVFPFGSYNLVIRDGKKRLELRK